MTCYMMVKAMPKLAGFLDRMHKPGTPVVSPAFWFPRRDVAAVQGDSGLLGATALYYWLAHRA